MPDELVEALAPALRRVDEDTRILIQDAVRELPPREQEVCIHLLHKRTSAIIGSEIGLSEDQVDRLKTKIRRKFAKLGMRNLIE